MLRNASTLKYNILSVVSRVHNRVLIVSNVVNVAKQIGQLYRHHRCCTTQYCELNVINTKLNLFAEHYTTTRAHAMVLLSTVHVWRARRHPYIHYNVAIRKLIFSAFNLIQNQTNIVSQAFPFTNMVRLLLN